MRMGVHSAEIGVPGAYRVLNLMSYTTDKGDSREQTCILKDIALKQTA